MAASLLLAACNGTPQAPMVGLTATSTVCIGSAGYQWSELTGQACGCSEQAVRLQSLEASETGSAFVLFNDDRSQAELTLPSGEAGSPDPSGEEGGWSWQGGAYQLYPLEGLCAQVRRAGAVSR